MILIVCNGSLTTPPTLYYSFQTKTKWHGGRSEEEARNEQRKAEAKTK